MRQALLQNQAPEIQAKLLAMQRQMEQSHTKIGVSPLAKSGGTGTTGREQSLLAASSTQAGARQPTLLTPVEAPRVKQRPLTQEQRDEQTRQVKVLVGAKFVRVHQSRT